MADDRAATPRHRAAKHLRLLARDHRPCGWQELTSVTTLDACGLNGVNTPFDVLYVLG